MLLKFKENLIQMCQRIIAKIRSHILSNNNVIYISMFLSYYSKDNGKSFNANTALCCNLVAFTASLAAVNLGLK